MGTTKTLTGLGRLLAATTIAWIGGCSSANTPVEWWLSVPRDAEAYFSGQLGEFEKSHPGVQVVMRLIPPEKLHPMLKDRIAKGELPTLVTMAQNDRAAFPVDTFQGWGNQIAPSATKSVFASLWDHPMGLAESTCIPLWQELSINVANPPLLEKGDIKTIPWRLSEMAEKAAAFHKKTGAYLWVPPLGDAEYAMELFDFQQVPILNTKLEAVFAARGGREALRWWAKQFQEGVFPLSAFEMTSDKALELFMKGELAVAPCTPVKALTLKDGPGFKVRGVAASREVTAASERSRTHVFGLFHPKKASLGMTGQNLVAYLLQVNSQRAIANGMNATPVTRDAIQDKDPGMPVAGNPILRFLPISYYESPFTTTTLGGLAERKLAARVIREAFVAACKNGVDPSLAIDEAAKKYTAAHHD